MIVIDNKLISDQIVEEQFVCDLSKCKGGCCEEGDAGAPLELWEKQAIDNSFEAAKEFITDESLAEIKRQGKYVYDPEFGWVTPTINSGICVYGYHDADNNIKCSFEQAYNSGKTSWKKPLSCHLYPIRISSSRQSKDTEYLNYEPRPVLCAGGCSLGKQLKVPVYVFLKEALIRKYGEEFYNTLDATAQYMNAKK